MPLFFLSGAIFPLGMAPEWLRVIAYINPVAYGVDGLRGVMSGISEFPIWLDLAILGIFSLAMVLLGAYLFKKMSA
jgi:ABC-2 type transport system permease protein